MKRQPEGIPTGGQFAPDRKGEPASSLTHLRPVSKINLDMNESENYGELADGDVVSDLSVTRTEVGFVVEATKPVNLHELVPAGLSYDEKNDWLDHNRTNLDAFLKDRYGAEVLYGQEGGWDDSTIQSTRTIPDDGNATQQRVADTAWDSLVQFHNESDNGTFGSENMDRLLQERCDSPAVIPEPSPDTLLVMSDADGTRYAKAGDIQKAPREGWKREYNRYTGGYTVTTPDGDSWDYKVSK